MLPGRGRPMERVLKRRIDRQRQNKTIKEHKKVARFESVAAAGVRTFVSVKRMRQQTGYPYHMYTIAANASFGR